MKTIFSLTLCSGLLFGMTACNTQPAATEQAAETNDARLGEDMEEAAEAMVETFGINNKILTISEMAASQTALPADLQTLVQKIQTDHQQVEQQLKNFAGKHNIELPSMINYDDNSDVGQLRAATPEEFANEFTELLDDINEELVEALDELEDEGGDVDAEVATFAQELLPTLRSHEEQIDQLEDAM